MPKKPSQTGGPQFSTFPGKFVVVPVLSLPFKRAENVLYIYNFDEFFVRLTCHCVKIYTTQLNGKQNVGALKRI